MAKNAPSLFPPVLRQLEALGTRLRLARLRRRFTSESVASRAGITRMTLYKVEKGDAGVRLGIYASVLRVLNLQADLDLLAKDDALGRKLQDLNLPERRVAPRRSAPPPT